MAYNFKPINTNFSNAQGLKKFNTLENKNIINYDNSYNEKEIDYNLIESEEITEEVKQKYSVINYDIIENQGFSPQGLTVIDNLAFISAYKDGEKSKLYVFDLNSKRYNSYIGCILLDQSGHVGGATYDPVNDILYVTASGKTFTTYDYSFLKKAMAANVKATGKFEFELKTINNMDYDTFYKELCSVTTKDYKSIIEAAGFDEETHESIYFQKWKKSKPGDELFDEITPILSKNYGAAIWNDIEAKNKASTTTFYDGKLYVAKFKGNQIGQMDIIEPTVHTSADGYKYITSKSILDEAIDIPDNVQGIAVTEYNGKEYIFYARSIGDKCSAIDIYYKKGNNYKFYGTNYIDQPGLEGIQINDSGELIGIFEKDKFSTTVLSVEKLLKNASHKNAFKESYLKFGGVRYNYFHGFKLTEDAEKKYKKNEYNVDPTSLELSTGLNIAGQIVSIAPRVIEGAIDFGMPSKLHDKKHVAEANTLNAGYGILDSITNEPYEIFSEQLYKHGTKSFLAKGIAKTSANIGLSTAEFAAQSTISATKTAVNVLNRMPLVNINTKVFDKTSSKINKVFNDSKDTTFEFFDEFGDNWITGAEDLVDKGKDFVKTSAKATKKIISKLKFW